MGVAAFNFSPQTRRACSCSMTRRHRCRRPTIAPPSIVTTQFGLTRGDPGHVVRGFRTRVSRCASWLVSPLLLPLLRCPALPVLRLQPGFQLSWATTFWDRHCGSRRTLNLRVAHETSTIDHSRASLHDAEPEPRVSRHHSRDGGGAHARRKRANGGRHSMRARSRPRLTRSLLAALSTAETAIDDDDLTDATWAALIRHRERLPTGERFAQRVAERAEQESRLASEGCGPRISTGSDSGGPDATPSRRTTHQRTDGDLAGGHGCVGRP